MLFSILVPVYNSERYLEECVESVLRQSEQDFELVLVNDGSTDGGGALCDRYRERFPERISVIHQPNRGLIMARRAGIAAAKGDYCMFLDADDAYEPECLAIVRETIENTGADVVIFNNYSYFEEDQSIEPNLAVYPDNTVFSGEGKRKVYCEMIRSWRLNNLCTKAIRVGLLKADDTDFEAYAANPHAEDLLQTLFPVTKASCIAYRAKELYRYRRHSQGMTRSAEPANIVRLFNAPVTQRLRDFMTLWGMDTPEHLALFQARKLNVLLVFFWQHYRGAKTSAQKRAVLDFDWNALLDDESRDFAKNRQLSALKRLQYNAIVNKRKLVLDLIATFGRMKMRAQHGA
jgi:glycosyltransferase involved in cell wall biosynthesis